MRTAQFARDTMARVLENLYVLHVMLFFTLKILDKQKREPFGKVGYVDFISNT